MTNSGIAETAPIWFGWPGVFGLQFAGSGCRFSHTPSPAPAKGLEFGLASSSRYLKKLLLE
jgi:hypothetical protein